MTREHDAGAFGLDGRRYPFVRHEFLGRTPAVGELVKFNVERGTTALRVTPIDANGRNSYARRTDAPKHGGRRRGIRSVSLTPAVRLPYGAGVDRRRFVVIALAGGLAAPLAAQERVGPAGVRGRFVLRDEALVSALIHAGV